MRCRYLCWCSSGGRAEARLQAQGGHLHQTCPSALTCSTSVGVPQMSLLHRSRSQLYLRQFVSQHCGLGVRDFQFEMPVFLTVLAEIKGVVLRGELN